jgi:hypothetical protein
MIGPLINFQKMRQIATLVHFIQQLQNDRYKFVVKEDLRFGIDGIQ